MRRSSGVPDGCTSARWRSSYLGEARIADHRLTAFVEAALKAGAPRQDIENALAEAGWSQAQIRDGLARFASVDFVVPVPQPRAELSARDAFMYLLMFGALYATAYHLGNLAFQLIHLAFPDELTPFLSAVTGQRIRWATSTLIVAFPVFLFVASRIARDIREEPARRNSAVRKWLTYLTLFVAAAVIIGDVIALVYNLLSGELTTRFVLKVLVVGAIAGVGFGYYLWSARADDEALGR